MTTRARCRDCGKTYRVGDAARRRACPACGGAVVAIDDAPAAAPEPRAPETAAVPPARAAAADSIAAGVEGDAAARLAASRELGTALRMVAAIRAIYATNAVIWGLLAALAVLVAFVGSRALDDDGEGASRIGAAVVAVVAFLFMAAGAVFVARKPLPWAIAIASVSAVNCALSVASSGLGVGPSIAITLTFLLCAAVPFLVRAQRILAAHPDLRAARRLRGERRETKGGAVYARSREAAGEAGDRAFRRMLLFGGVAVGGVALVAVVLDFLSPPTPREVSAARSAAAAAAPFDPVAARFRDAWNASRFDEIARFYRTDSREKMGRVFSRLVEKKGWSQALPRLAAPDVVPGKSGTSHQAFFMLEAGGGVVETAWSFGDEGWVLRRLSPP